MERCIDPIQAVQNGWVELWYQPKVDAQALAMLGAEALLRVRHPVVGIVVFYAAGCLYCNELRDRVIPAMEKELGVSVEWNGYPVDDPENFER
jgi:hypothetical protein